MTERKTHAKKQTKLTPKKMRELESDFRANLMTWRAMAEKFGVSMRWIREIAELNGWNRDLSTKISQGAERKVQEAVAREMNLREPIYLLSEREITDANADVVAMVTTSHRRNLARTRQMAEKLLDELEFAGANKEVLEALVADLYANKETAKADMISRIASIQGRTTSFKQLVDALKVIITTEREVLKINADAGPENPVAALIAKVMGSGFKPVAEHADD